MLYILYEKEFFCAVEGTRTPRLSALDPKSSAATNYATTANGNANIQLFIKLLIFLLLFSIMSR